MKHAILAEEECGKTDRVGAKLFKVNQSAICRIYNRYNETKAVYREPTQVDHEKLPKINYSKIYDRLEEF